MWQNNVSLCFKCIFVPSLLNESSEQIIGDLIKLLLSSTSCIYLQIILSIQFDCSMCSPYAINQILILLGKIL